MPIPRDVLGLAEVSRLVASIHGESGGGQGGRPGGRPPPGEPPRPPHIIRPDAVDAWLADSANKVVTYHRTTIAAAQDIVEQGVDVTRSRIGSFGQGFYTATDVRHLPGEVDLAVAVRTRQPLIGDLDDVEPQMDDLVARFGGPQRRLTPAVAARIRQELVEQGYDGIVVRDAGGDGVDYVIALEDSSVKVVQP